MPSIVGAGLSVIRRPAISVDIITVTPETGDVTESSSALPWNLSSFSYLGAHFITVGQDTAPHAISFKDDGTKMYMIGATNDTVYQYSLSTAWNISTASYDLVSHDMSDQDISPTGVFFKPDGSIMYMLGNANDKIYQYALPSPWVVNGAIYGGLFVSVTSEDTVPTGISFKPDGTKMYIIGNTGNTVYQYTLSTPWTVSTATYDTVSFSVTSEGTVPQGIFFKPDGTKMYMVDAGGQIVYQYSLSTAWDLSTASYDLVLFDLTGSISAGSRDVFFKPDGTRMYVVELSNSRVYQYDT